MRIRKGTTEHVGDLLQIGAGLDVSQTDGITTLEVSAGTITVREADGSPSFFADTLEFPNGSVVQDGTVAKLIFGEAGVPPTRVIATGTGLTGGGNLTQDRTISIDTSVVPLLASSNVFTNPQYIRNTTTALHLSIEAGTGSTHREASLNLRHGTADRWSIRKTANSAGDLQIVAYSNQGQPTTALSIDRSNAVVTFSQIPMVGSLHLATQEGLAVHPTLVHRNTAGNSLPTAPGQLAIFSADSGDPSQPNESQIEALNINMVQGGFLKIQSIQNGRPVYAWVTSTLSGQLEPGDGIGGGIFNGNGSRTWSVVTLGPTETVTQGFSGVDSGKAAGKIGFVQVDGQPTLRKLAVVLGPGGDEAAPGNHSHPNLVPGNGISGNNYNGQSSQTWSIQSHPGTSGQVGTLTITANQVGVTLGNTATTAAPGNHTHAALTPGNGINGFAYNGSTGYTWSIQSHAGTSGSVGTIVVTSDRVGVSLGTTSTTAAAGNHTHTAGQVGAYTIAEVNNLLAGKANLTGATFTGTVIAPYINAAIARTGDGGVNTANAIILYPEGGALRVNAASGQGAIKIRLPVLWTNTMIRMRVEVHRYTGPSYTLWIEGYNYATNSTWQNADVQTNSTTETVTVRFGNDGVRSCIWIGNTDTTWSYPFVRIAELQTSHSSGNSVTTWRQGWEMSLVQSFDTVQVTRTVGPLATLANIESHPALIRDGTPQGATWRKGQLLVWGDLPNDNKQIQPITLNGAGIGRFLRIASINSNQITYEWSPSTLSGQLISGAGIDGADFNGSGSATWSIRNWTVDMGIPNLLQALNATPGMTAFGQIPGESKPRLVTVLGFEPYMAAPGDHLHDGRYYTKAQVDSSLNGKANSSITISAGTGLTGGGNLTANRTLSVDTNTIATRAYVQGAFQPINAALNNIKTRTGSYGSINLDGSAGGYAGIHFEDVSRVLMVSASVQGFHTGSAWQWYFNNGTLTAGSVPTARIPAGTFQSGGYVFPGDVSVGNVLTEGGTRVAKVIISSSGPSGSAPHGTFWAQV